ncbi:Uma2 family endonuclease [sulfur-oxidizing endosymbiont of Gigantopelta aegis]|uniref:Uma2 family endonuclease n=1 Tax=sulfur-oxidizing endosymbiont of Gigantopelta aegis TaxID=2794934 RepID=UPI002483C411|nr:Uma2 family endonuclease [sulfur-oxidizing endosymbiont of Gigantopelta aegis]
MPSTDNEQYLSKAPDIIFEVLSKSTAHKDRTTKFHLYEAEGVKFYILVDQYENTAIVYKLDKGKYIKLNEVNSETVTFELDNCIFDFEFKKYGFKHVLYRPDKVVDVKYIPSPYP